MFHTAAYGQISFKRAGDYYALCKDSVPVTPYVYTEVSKFHEGIAWVNKGDLYGYIDTNLAEITLFQFTDVSAFQNGYAVVSLDSLFGYINRMGEMESTMHYLEALPMQHGLAAVRDSMGWTMLDTSFRPISIQRFDIPPKALSDDFIIVSRNGSWGVTNRKGEIIHALTYDLITTDGVGYNGKLKTYFGLF